MFLNVKYYYYFFLFVLDIQKFRSTKIQISSESRNTFPTSFIQRGVIKIARKVNIVECTSGANVIARVYCRPVHCSEKHGTKTNEK